MTGNRTWCDLPKPFLVRYSAIVIFFIFLSPLDDSFFEQDFSGYKGQVFNPSLVLVKRICDDGISSGPLGDDFFEQDFKQDFFGYEALVFNSLLVFVESICDGEEVERRIKVTLLFRCGGSLFALRFSSGETL